MHHWPVRRDARRRGGAEGRQALDDQRARRRPWLRRPIRDRGGRSSWLRRPERSSSRPGGRQRRGAREQSAIALRQPLGEHWLAGRPRADPPAHGGASGSRHGCGSGSRCTKEANPEPRREHIDALVTVDDGGEQAQANGGRKGRQPGQIVGRVSADRIESNDERQLLAVAVVGNAHTAMTPMMLEATMIGR